MGKTSIPYVTHSLNFSVGCSHSGSPGCDNCFAARLAATRLKHHPLYEGLAEIKDGVARWTGEVRLNPKALEEPLRARKPRRYLVCSMGDLFHESVSDNLIGIIFAQMVATRRHSYLLLTKRPRRMRACMAPDGSAWKYHNFAMPYPMPNIWPGVTVETQDQIWRVEELVKIPAAGYWVSGEPCLGPLDFGPHLPHLSLVVLGGETGPNARPMNPDWARKVRDDCVAAGVPFWFKGWGEWWTGDRKQIFDEEHRMWGDGLPLIRTGRKLAGRELDGQEWNQLPKGLMLEGEE